MAAEPRTRLNYSLTAHDIATEKLILATHAPDGTYIVAPLLKVIEDIMHKANPGASHQGNHAELDLIAESEIYDDINEILEVMSPIINKVSREISYKCIGGADTHKTTLAIFNLLSNYEWDAKAVITLAAFALNYGEFWLVAQPYPVCRLAKSVANIKQLPDVLEPLFEDVNYLIKVVLDLTRCLIRFLELPKQYINPKTPELQTAAALIPTAVYWIIRSIVECVSMLMSLTGMRHEDVITKTTKAPELSSLGRMIIEFHDQIRQQLYLCYNHINEMEKNVEYAMIVRVMETPHLDNMKPLKHWFKDDQLPLYESSTKKRINSSHAKSSHKASAKKSLAKN